MYNIPLNASGSHVLTISEDNLNTIHKYGLFKALKDSNDYVDEDVLDKLKCHIRSLIAHSDTNSKDLLDLCIDVIYHKKMKAYGLSQLIQLYEKWEKTCDIPSTES